MTELRSGSDEREVFIDAKTNVVYRSAEDIPKERLGYVVPWSQKLLDDGLTPFGIAMLSIFPGGDE